jgi:hypothetical protein
MPIATAVGIFVSGRIAEAHAVLFGSHITTRQTAADRKSDRRPMIGARSDFVNVHFASP